VAAWEKIGSAIKNKTARMKFLKGRIKPPILVGWPEAGASWRLAIGGSTLNDFII